MTEYEDETNEHIYSNNETEPLDNKWLIEFENSEKIYRDYYKDDNYYANVHYAYVNANDEIEKIKQEFIYMSKPNCILRDELIGLLKRNSIDNNIRYTLLSILKINISIDPMEIKRFLVSDNLDYYKNLFFSPIKNLDNIIFEKTINMFQDLNEIFILFYEKHDSVNSKPKNITKKIYLKTSHKKTIKKTI